MLGDSLPNPHRATWVFLIMILPVITFSQNAIVLENQLPGTPDSIWDIESAGDPEIQGFASDISVDQGETIDFKIKTPSSDYRIEIYRLGWYNGDGARLVTTIQPSAPPPKAQPDCAYDPTVNLFADMGARPGTLQNRFSGTEPMIAGSESPPGSTWQGSVRLTIQTSVE